MADPHWRARLAEVQDLLLVAHDNDDVVRAVLSLTNILSDEWARQDQPLLDAAPDLLEACRRLLKFNEELCVDVNVSTHYPSADFARAAIAKAEGRT